DGGDRIDAVQPAADRLVAGIRQRKQIDVRRKLGPVDVFAARAIVHRRAADRDANGVVARANLGRRYLELEHREASRLAIERHLEDGQPRSVFLDDRAQGRPPPIDVGLRVGRGDRARQTGSLRAESAAMRASSAASWENPFEATRTATPNGRTPPCSIARSAAPAGSSSTAIRGADDCGSAAKTGATNADSRST